MEHGEQSLVTPPAVSVACDTKPRPISFTFSLLVSKAALHLPKRKKSLGSTVIITAFFNEVMDITKTVKTSSQSSQETGSSQEVREHLNPWSRKLDEAQERHEVQLDALVDEYKRNGDSENVNGGTEN